MLLSKENSPSDGSSEGNGENVVSSKCPWTWQVDTKYDRIPRDIVYAKCGSACDIWYCKPVKYNMIILYRKKKSPADVWKMRNKKITVAYVYTK